jgi:hypothetical protein
MSPPKNIPQEEGASPPLAARSDLRDFVGGLLLLAVSVTFAVASLRIPFKNETWEWYTSPGIFALAMAVCLGGCSIAVGWRGLRGWRMHRDGTAPPDWRGGLRAWGMSRFLAAVGTIGLYLILLGRVPFLVASAGLILVFGTAFRGGNALGGLRPAIIAAGIIVVFSYAIMTVFGVVFP